MLGMFNLMEHYNLHPPADLEFKSPVNGTRTGLNMHRITEAMKFAFGARTEIGDPDTAFMDEKRRERVTGFSEREWAERIGKELTDVSGPGRRARRNRRIAKRLPCRTRRIPPSTTIPSSTRSPIRVPPICRSPIDGEVPSR
jgi:gamma-glutamyltranspeptidase